MRMDCQDIQIVQGSCYIPKENVMEANIILGIIALIGSILAIGKSIDDKNKKEGHCDL
ncbi:hypothetical protein SAMN05216234_1096 [Hydrogenimonas thermophila]|uniref:Uncharacterized protein n=1 Tax=Hydrogenimonas thermophila TaxID=223786 RepID=A0A1I5N8H5_9BACT|nr:hypothetical protein SAMN05216234_1096 [Hydrogenimonas thermophila]